MNRVCESDLSLGEQLALIESRKSIKKILHSIPATVESESRTLDHSDRLDKRTLAIFETLGGKMKNVYDFVDEVCSGSIHMKTLAKKYGVQRYTVQRAKYDPNGFIDTCRKVVRIMKERGNYE